MELPNAKTMYVVPEWIQNHCVVPDGFRKGAPFTLYDFQLLFVANFYLVRDSAEWVPDNPVLAPAFVFRRGLLVGPQKIGKDPLAAVHICVEGAGPALFAGWAGKDDGWACSDHGCRCGWEYAYDPGEPMGMMWPTPLIQITAFSEEQTDNTYDALRPMIDNGPLHDLIPKTGEAFIRLPGGGRIDTVTSSAQSRLGQRVTFVSQGEVGIWTKSNKMDRVADTQYRGLAGMGGRASLNTNAWDPTEKSVAQVQYESSAEDVYRQFVQPPKSLSYTNKAERRKIHRSVYPADVLKENGGHLDLDAIENEAADLVERDPTQAERFYGNRPSASGGAAVDPTEWDALAKPHEVPAGITVGLGFDGSNNRDATVLRACTEDGYSFIVGLWQRGPDDPPEWVVPREEVHKALDAAFRKYRVGRMFCDPWKWHSEIEGWAEKYDRGPKPEDAVVLAFDTNVTSKFALAVDRWLTSIREGVHTHDGDPLTTDHVKAAHKKQVRLADDPADGRTRYVLVKGEDRRKIDAAVADVLAYEAAMTMTPPPTKREPRFAWR